MLPAKICEVYTTHLTMEDVKQSSAVPSHTSINLLYWFCSIYTSIYKKTNSSEKLNTHLLSNKLKKCPMHANL